MFKKIALVAVAALGLGATLEAAPVDLSLFGSDFNTLVTGMARDVAPTLRLNALAGDLQADAHIEHFTFTPIGFGFAAADGIATALDRQNNTVWQFQALPLTTLVEDATGGSSFFEHLMVYPGFQSAFGLGFGTWDVTVSGTYFPGEITSALTSLDGSGTAEGLHPTFTFGNFGLAVRKSLVPDLSLGVGYHYTFFDLGMNLKSLADVGGTQDLGGGQTLDLSGEMRFKTQAHIGTVDLHYSHTFWFLTPFVKLTGAYQNSTFDGKTELVARVVDSNNSANNTDSPIHSHPVVNVSDFAFLATTGLDVNLFLFHVDVNVVGDLSRAFLKVHDLSLDGSDANAFVVNTGIRVAF